MRFLGDFKNILVVTLFLTNKDDFMHFKSTEVCLIK